MLIVWYYNVLGVLLCYCFRLCCCLRYGVIDVLYCVVLLYCVMCGVVCLCCFTCCIVAQTVVCYRVMGSTGFSVSLRCCVSAVLL